MKIEIMSSEITYVYKVHVMVIMYYEWYFEGCLDL